MPGNTSVNFIPVMMQLLANILSLYFVYLSVELVNNKNCIKCTNHFERKKFSDIYCGDRKVIDQTVHTIMSQL